MNELIKRLRIAAKQMEILRHQDWAKLVTEAADELDKPEINIFDECERHQNCTVEILRNSVTGEIGVGWYRNGDEDVGT